MARHHRLTAVTADRGARTLFAAALGVLATFAVLNVAWPGWPAVDLDGEENLPAYFQAGLLAAACLAALDALRVEAGLLGRFRRPRGWAAAGWLAVAGGLAFQALDEALQIHKRLNGDAMEAALPAASPLHGTVVWLVVALPAILTAVAGLTGWLLARARLDPGFVRWAGAGIALWLAALVLEGTAKPFFIPRGLYALEVLLEETAEGVGTTLLLYAIWRYRSRLHAWPAGWHPVVPPRLRVPWGLALVVGFLAVAIPSAIVAAAIALNPAARQKGVGDAHLQAGRFELVARAYRAAVTQAPRWRWAWEKLGIAELRRDSLDAAREALVNAERLAPRSAVAGAVREAEARYRRALELRAGAPAHLGLALLAREAGRADKVRVQLAAARALDRQLPALAPDAPR